MEMLQQLESYLIDTKQIDRLARRQATLICRAIADKALREEATIIVLLVLAALRKGSPRTDRSQLIAPLASENISFYSATYHATCGFSPSWANSLTGCQTFFSKSFDALIAEPCRYAPLSGKEPAYQDDIWPILVVGSKCIGFSRYWSALKKLEKVHLPKWLNLPTDHIADETIKKALNYTFVIKSILCQPNVFHYRQIAAAALACRSRFLIISGGPGTGKTSVILQLLRTLLRAVPEISYDRIVLCAPTGRAKARLGESFDNGLHAPVLSRTDGEDPDVSTDRNLAEIHRKTIHSLLGQRPDGSFRYNRNNRLPYKVVVVDEASMVDLTLFTALLEALSDDGRLILAGDMHQLPSVEAGAVLGDLTECFNWIPHYASVSEATGNWIGTVTAGIPSDGNDEQLQMTLTSPEYIQKAGPLADHVIILTRSYRSSRAILDVAKTINRGDAAAALSLLSATESRTTITFAASQDTNAITTWIDERFSEIAVQEAYQVLDNRKSLDFQSPVFISAVKTALFSSAILTLTHAGRRGRITINALAEKLLRERLNASPDNRFFHGLPVILNGNHHALDLFNGDLGIVIHYPNESMKVCFPRGDTCRIVACDRLNGLETAFALTVHKAQGSEFDNILLVLPDRQNPLLTRQIIYTAITRAKRCVQIVGSEQILGQAITRLEERKGGVRIFNICRNSV